MVKLENITSVCEVALTANFVLGYFLLKYIEIRHKSIILISRETKSIEYLGDDNYYVFKNGNKFSVSIFQRSKTLFIISAILSIIAVIFSFFILLLTGLYPTYEISTSLYIFFAVLFIIINPIVYFIVEISFMYVQRSIGERQLKTDEISELVKSHISMPMYHEPILRKLKWYIYFKSIYIKRILTKLFSFK